MSRGHARGTFEPMEETLAFLALGAEQEERTVLSGIHTLIVDPINGSDTGGSIDGPPIKTIAKLNDIVNDIFISGGTLTVRVLSSPPITDAELDLTIQYENAIINPDLPFGFGASPFIMLGSLTNVAHTGTLATVVPVTYVAPPGTPLRETVTDLTVPDWTVFQFQPLIPTSGIDVGFFAWVAPPLPPNLSTGFTSSPTDQGGFPGQLSVGDSYIIVNQTQVKLRQITVFGDGSGLTEFHDLHFIQWQNSPVFIFQGANCVINNFDADQTMVFGRCRFDPVLTGSGQEVFITACCLTTGYNGGRWVFIGGIIVPFVNSAPSAALSSVYLFGITFGGGANLLDDDIGGAVDFFFQFPINGILDQGCQFWDWGFGPAWQVVGSDVVVQCQLSGRSAFPQTIGVEVTSGGIISLLQDPRRFLGVNVVIPTPNIVGTGGYLLGSNGTDTDFTIDDVLALTAPPAVRSHNIASSGTTSVTSQDVVLASVLDKSSVYVAIEHDAASIASVTDSAGNAYTQANTISFATLVIDWWFTDNVAAAGPLTITVTGASSGHLVVEALELTGTNTTNSLDVAGSGTANSNSDTVTPSQTNDLCLLKVGDLLDPGSYTASGGSTSIDANTGDGGVTQTIAGSDLSKPGGAGGVPVTISASFSGAQTPGQFGALALAVKGVGDPVSRAWQEGPGTFTAQIHNSWVNFQTAQPAGFGASPADSTSISNAQSVASGSRIVNAHLET